MRDKMHNHICATYNPANGLQKPVAGFLFCCFSLFKQMWKQALPFPGRIAGLALLAMLAACAPEGERENEVDRIDEYFDVQGLLEQTEAQLRRKAATLEKKAEFSGEVETSTILLDSAALAEELDVFREVDINKPVFSGRYLERKEMEEGLEVTIYEADDKEELSINYLKIYRQPDTETIERIEALFSSQNILYNSTRSLSLDYGQIGNERLPLSYYVEGVQKMIFNDKEGYTIKADFQYPGFDK